MLPTNTDLVAEQWFYYFLYINECWHLIIGGSIELENMWIPERFVHEDIVGIIHLSFWTVLLISARGCVVRISYKLRKWCRLNMHHIILLLRVTIIQVMIYSIVIMILLNNKRVSLSGELHILCLIIQYFEHFLQQPFSASLPPKLSPYILHPPYYRAITIDSIWAGSAPAWTSTSASRLAPCCRTPRLWPWAWPWPAPARRWSAAWPALTLGCWPRFSPSSLWTACGRLAYRPRFAPAHWPWFAPAHRFAPWFAAADASWLTATDGARLTSACTSRFAPAHWSRLAAALWLGLASRFWPWSWSRFWSWPRLWSRSRPWPVSCFDGLSFFFLLLLLFRHLLVLPERFKILLSISLHLVLLLVKRPMLDHKLAVADLLPCLQPPLAQPHPRLQFIVEDPVLPG